MRRSVVRVCHASSIMSVLLWIPLLWADAAFALQADVVSGGAYTSNVKQLDVQALPQTIQTEYQDRINRIARLSKERNVPAPEVIEHLQVDPGLLKGVDYPIPVIRIVYNDRSLFDSDEDDLRQDAQGILTVIAETIKRDLPDTQLFVVGHTDSVGDTQYNDDLAQRRAANVMRDLAGRGVPIQQLATAAVGERQPIATNATEAGRAINRRVEFMISAFFDANLRLVESRVINMAWLDNHKPPVLRASTDTKKLAMQNAANKQLLERREIAVVRPTETITSTGSSEQAVHALRQVDTIRLQEPRVIALRND